ncbi:hypothetical protein BOTBODRAFT_36729 [Botryobasidium botryosum FD-172 SS1]|uniref:PH domain-containing protein n=1 Tax=Botryobasidium botryosum (strain FD-172 SS1) TaxID=930990 RepID=A0A067M5E5_BOTB1|nr:hypothetical protein BOTBODRAFT_36729 [Botryobasidium botryosum FD-172 SS1]
MAADLLGYAAAADAADFAGAGAGEQASSHIQHLSSVVLNLKHSMHPYAKTDPSPRLRDRVRARSHSASSSLRVFIPAFLSRPANSTPTEEHPQVPSPEPYPIDDDPFACRINPVPSSSCSTATLSTPALSSAGSSPPSPAPTDDDEQDIPILPLPPRKFSAHYHRRRPPLRARPSLPSLSTLAHTELTYIPGSRNSAAARFPVEPWSQDFRIEQSPSHFQFPRSAVYPDPRENSTAENSLGLAELHEYEEAQDLVNGHFQDIIGLDPPFELDTPPVSRRTSMESILEDFESDPLSIPLPPSMPSSPPRSSIASELTITPERLLEFESEFPFTPSRTSFASSLTGFDNFRDTMTSFASTSPPRDSFVSQLSTAAGGSSSNGALSYSGTTSRRNHSRQPSGNEDPRDNGGREPGYPRGNGQGGSGGGGGGGGRRNPRSTEPSDADSASQTSDSESETEKNKKKVPGRATHLVPPSHNALGRARSSSPRGSSSTSSALRSNTISQSNSPPRMPNSARLPPSKPMHVNESDDSDNMPLAQRIPTALTAQKTIRKTEKDASDARRRERIARHYARLEREEREEKEKKEKDVSTLDVPPAVPREGRKRPAILQLDVPAAAAMSGQTSAKVMTPPPLSEGVAPDDLARRLLTVQQATSSADDIARGKSPAVTPGGLKSTGTLSRRPTAPSDRRAKTPDPNQAPPLPYTPLPPPAPWTTTTTAPSLQRRPSQPFAQAPSSSNAVSRSRTVMHTRRRSQSIGAPMQSTAAQASALNTVGSRPAVARSRSVRDIKAAAASTEDVPPVPGISRSRSVRDMKATAASSDAVPPVPAVAQSMGTQRVYINDMQQYRVVELRTGMRARDVLDIVEREGVLSNDAGHANGWALWELSNDFGMERPIREYELISDILETWNKEVQINAFMVKRTPLAPLLLQTAIPPSLPLGNSWVQWEGKKGKWSKRWIQLREQSIFLSKRDNGKDETFLCSLSNFDVYIVTRAQKLPKPFMFAVKSTANLSLFENPSDGVHMFCCDRDQGERLVERILVARSYVLFHERRVLFQTPSGSGGNSNLAVAGGSKSGLSRSSTRRTAPRQVTSPAPLVPNLFPSPWAEGSLLAKATSTDGPSA